MQRKALKRTLPTWLALFAILLAALAPSISHAISAAKGETWMELCTVEGVKYIKFGSSTPDQTPPAQKSSGMEHCPFCATSGGTAVIPPSTSLVVPLPDMPATMPSLFFQSPYPQPIWRTAQSRAPPFFA